MSNLVDHAKRELDLIGMTEDNPDEMNCAMRKCILDIIELFATQGHSGFSASYVISIVPRLLQYENLSPITNDPVEWMQVGTDPNMCQSIRNPALFSMDGGKTYYHVDDRSKKEAEEHNPQPAPEEPVAEPTAEEGQS